MSRMYSRKKGKSGSKKPLVAKKYTWVHLKPKEIEAIIGKLAKEGKSAAEIGLMLRDSYAIPSTKAVLSKSIGNILVEKKLTGEVPDDLLALIRTSVNVSKHVTANKKDMTALRGLQLTNAKIKHLVKYYKGTGRLPLEWKYDAESLKFYVE